MSTRSEICVEQHTELCILAIDTNELLQRQRTLSMLNFQSSDFNFSQYSVSLSARIWVHCFASSSDQKFSIPPQKKEGGKENKLRAVTSIEEC
jgi:hypothetical protein